MLPTPFWGKAVLMWCAVRGRSKIVYIGSYRQVSNYLRKHRGCRMEVYA